MKKWLAALTLFLAMGFAQSVEVGGELAPDGLRPYLVLSKAYPLGDGLYLVPSLFFYRSVARHRLFRPSTGR